MFLHINLGINSQTLICHFATVLLPYTPRMMIMTDAEYALALGNIPVFDVPDILEPIRNGEDLEQENDP